jgi:RNA polymerase sigma-70 factor, ECF subfamily
VSSAFSCDAALEDLDAKLVQRFVDGDTEAFDVLFERHHSYVYNVCFNVTGNAEDARDATQEAFVQVYRKASCFNGASAFSTWLYRIAVNQSLDLLRRRSRRPTVPMPEDFEVSNSDDGLADYHRREDIRESLAALKPEQKAILVLRYFQELSYEEMAEVLDMSVGQVKIKLHRARQAFKERYGGG